MKEVTANKVKNHQLFFNIKTNTTNYKNTHINTTLYT